MLATATVETFTPHVGGTFLLHAASAAPVALTLIEARGTVTDNDARRTRAPFSLVFRGPAGAAFTQGTYRLERAGLAPFDLFLVPIVPDGEGSRLEAVFS